MFHQHLESKSSIQKSLFCLLGLLTICWLIFGIVRIFPYEQASKWSQNQTVEESLPEESLSEKPLPTGEKIPDLGLIRPESPQTDWEQNLPTLSPEILKSLVAQGLVSEPITIVQIEDKLNKPVDLPVQNEPFAPSPLEDAQLIIPSLDLTQSITQVPVVSGQWDISELHTQVGHLQTTGEVPNQGHAMTFIGHATVPWPGVGPFADLIQVEHGEEIIYRWGGTDYIYEVSRILLVNPSSVESLYEADGEMLILATCSGWDFVDREYAKRLVTQAKLIRTEPAPIEDRGLEIGDQ